MSEIELLERLVEIEGFHSIDALLKHAIFDSVCPAICTNSGCNNTANLEPDQDAGFCDMCGTNTMKSAEVLWLSSGEAWA